MQKFIFKGFKQVSYADYLAAEVKKGYLWFVRSEAGVAENRNDDSYDIYFGEKHYGHFQAGELDAIRTSISDHLTAFNTYKTEVADAFTAVNNAITAAITEAKSYTNGEVEKEANRAKGVEAELSAAISANTTAIATEKGRAEGVEAELSAAITTEKERAEGAEKALGTRIDNIVADAKTYSIAKVEGTLDENVKEAFKLVDEDGTQVGETIKIYKDSSLISIELVDEKPAETEDEEPIKGQFLKYTYLLANGNQETVYVDANKFLVETEFSNGLQVSGAGVVSVKLDLENEKYLTFGANGELVSTGIDTAIENAVEVETNRAISAETANANAIIAEKERAISAETANANAIVAEKERAEAAEAKVLEDAKKYTDDEVTELKNYTDATFVTKEGFNEFEAEYEEKLNGIAAGAEVNVIESITVNGVDAKIAEGTKHATVTIDTKKIMHGEGETAATVSSVLEGIKASIYNINTNALTSVVGGDGITVSEFAGNKQTISVNLYGEDNVATLKDGKLYVAPLYYDGDDAE